MTRWIQISASMLVGIVIGAGGYAAMFRSTTFDTTAEASQTPAVDAKPVLPEIPISVSCVEARSDRGYVVQFHNQSQKHLAVLLELENKTFDQRKSGPLQLAPGQMVEIGGTPEWTFVSGKTATMKLDGYLTKSFQAP